MEIAEELGANIVTVCPLNDGSDYPFEIDYRSAWENTVSCIRECADFKPTVKISIEYKTCEPRMHVLVRDAGRAALLAKVIDRDNVGVTLDVGHAFEAGEIPAESVDILASVDKLFYVHINDNFRNWDWDMIPGTVNTLEMVEFIYVLKSVGYDSWLTIDVYPWRFNPVKVFSETIEWMEHCRKISEKIDAKILKDLQETADAIEVLRYIRSLL
jgi:xylose isomerase